MAHHVYNTEGFIIESQPRGEANKMYLIFTKELGMVRASAQGVRLMKSKLRFALQDLSFAKVSLVRGKDMWKLTNAKAEWSLYSAYKDRKDLLFATAQILTLLKRLIHGEEKNEALFTMLINAFRFIHQEALNPDEIKAFERIVVLNILHELGYGGAIKTIHTFINVQISKELLGHMIQEKDIALQEINRALRESQL